jgi:hypothetical protein
LQLGVKREYASGLSIIANYIWSRTKDAGTATPSGGSAHPDQIQNDYDLKKNYARSTSDVPTLIAVGGVYPLPVGKGKAFLNQGGVSDVVLGGWQISTVATAHSGLTFTPTVATANLSGALDGTWYPNRIAGGKPAHQTVTEWFDPSAFTVPAAGSFGNSGRNILRAPPFKNVDLSLAKKFTLSILGEGGLLEIRASASDVFNHMNFGTPNAGIGGAGTGQITSVTTVRNLQFGARIAF